MDAANELEHYRQQTNKSRSLYRYIEELQKGNQNQKTKKRNCTNL